MFDWIVCLNGLGEVISSIVVLGLIEVIICVFIVVIWCVSGLLCGLFRIVICLFDNGFFDVVCGVGFGGCGGVS